MSAQLKSSGVLNDYPLQGDSDVGDIFMLVT